MGYEFQSTRPHGARRKLLVSGRQRPQRFNPRARTGRDPLSTGTLRGEGCFNPRARTGRDQAGLIYS